MKIQKSNTGIIITKTAKQPSAKIEFSLDELDALSEFCERLQDEKDIREYLNTAVTIPDSAEVSAPIAAKYLRDAALFEQLVDETRRNQEPERFPHCRQRSSCFYRKKPRCQRMARFDEGDCGAFCP